MSDTTGTEKWSQVPKDSGVKSTVSDAHTTSSTHLKIPPSKLVRRPSAGAASPISEISELSFGSTQADGPEDDTLLRTISTTSTGWEAISTPSTWRQKLHEIWIVNYGAFLVLVSQVFGTAMTVSTRMLEIEGSHGKPMHPFQILFTRQSITSLFCICYALWSKSAPHFPLGPPGLRWLLVIRGVAGSFGVIALYFSLVYLPVSEATVLTFLSPVLSCYAFSFFIPGETFSKQQQIAGFVCLLGVVFISRPLSLLTSPGATSGSGHVPTNNLNGRSETYNTPSKPTPTQHLQAVGIAMIGVAGSIAAYTSIRAMGTRVHAFISVFYFSVWCTIVSLLALILVPGVSFRFPNNALEWGLLSIIGFCGFIMQSLMTVGLAYGGPASPARDVPKLQSQDIEMQEQAGIGSGSDDPLSHNRDVVSDHQRQRSSTKGKAKPPLRVSATRATSMLYTQMLFALIGDKVLFGVTPDLWSWIGSSLILGGAIWVAADGGGKGEQKQKRSVPAQDYRGINAETQPHEETVGLLRDIDAAEPEEEQAEMSCVLAASASSATDAIQERQ